MSSTETYNSLVDVGFRVYNNTGIVYHLEVNEEKRNEKVGSTTIQVLKQVAAGLNLKKLQVQMCLL